MKATSVSLGGGFYSLTLPLVWTGTQPTVALSVKGTVMRVISTPIPLLVSGTSIPTSVVWVGREIIGEWDSLSFSASAGLQKANNLNPSSVTGIVIYVGTSALDNAPSKLLEWQDLIVGQPFTGAGQDIEDQSGTLYTYQPEQVTGPAAGLIVQCYLIRRKELVITVEKGASLDLEIRSPNGGSQLSAYGQAAYPVVLHTAGRVLLTVAAGSGNAAIAETYVAVPWPLNQ